MNEPLTPLIRLLLKQVGLHLDGPMHGRLDSIVERQAAEAACEVTEFVDSCLRSPDTLASVVDELTVKETYFLREPGQLRAFIEHVVPLLPDPLTVWSAACATGQEAYSLAMLLREAGRPDATILATDVSDSAVAQARTGWYSHRELRGLDSQRQDRWMAADGDGWRVRPEIRTMVRCQPHNLVSDSPPLPPGQTAVIFLRNVLIYFPATVCRSVLQRLSGTLHADGWLFLGAGETLTHSPTALRIEQLPGAFAYRRVHARAAGRIPAPRRGLQRHASAARSGPALTRTEQVNMVLLLAAAGRAAACRDYPTAVATYRKAAYLDPAGVEAHVQLAFTLEASGDLPAATRAFGVALQLARAAGDCLPPGILEGYTAAAFMRLLEQRADITQQQHNRMTRNEQPGRHRNPHPGQEPRRRPGARGR